MHRPRRNTVQLQDRALLGKCLGALQISERELGRRAGLAHATVNHLASGRRTTCRLATGRAIETALGIERGQLFIAVKEGHQ